LRNGRFEIVPAAGLGVLLLTVDVARLPVPQREARLPRRQPEGRRHIGPTDATVAECVPLVGVLDEMPSADSGHQASSPSSAIASRMACASSRANGAP